MAGSPESLESVEGDTFLKTRNCDDNGDLSSAEAERDENSDTGDNQNSLNNTRTYVESGSNYQPEEEIYGERRLRQSYQGEDLSTQDSSPNLELGPSQETNPRDPDNQPLDTDNLDIILALTNGQVYKVPSDGSLFAVVLADPSSSVLSESGQQAVVEQDSISGETEPVLSVSGLELTSVESWIPNPTTIGDHSGDAAQNNRSASKKREKLSPEEKKEKNRKRAEMNRLKAKENLKKKDSDYKDLQSQHEDLKTKYKDLHAENMELKSQKEDLKRKYEDLQSENKESQKRCRKRCCLENGDATIEKRL